MVNALLPPTKLETDLEGLCDLSSNSAYILSKFYVGKDVPGE